MAHLVVTVLVETHPPNPLSLNPFEHPPNIQTPFWYEDESSQILTQFPFDRIWPY